MATLANEQRQTASASLSNTIVYGIVAGLIGGSVFGIMMATMQMLPMVASMVGSQSIVVGFVLHMIISAIIGGIYGVIAPRLPTGWLVVIAAGVVYGILWWVLGALILMPLILGMGEMVLQIGDTQWMGLVGHVVFGIVTATLYILIAEHQ